MQGGRATPFSNQTTVNVFHLVNENGAAVKLPEITEVYVVDDDEAVLRSTQALLEVKGYQVRTFSSGENFLAYAETLQSLNSSCLLVDLNMPGMNGPDVISSVTQRHYGIPVIAMTADINPTFRQQALANGAIRVLNKPFDAADLVSLLQSLT